LSWACLSVSRSATAAQWTLTRARILLLYPLRAAQRVVCGLSAQIRVIRPCLVVYTEDSLLVAAGGVSNCCPLVGSGIPVADPSSEGKERVKP
jgi:hypothetical protein